ncbi:RNA polymerase sigma factor [Lignipirellula cremea]|uniref:RNA polymerase sigma factor SigM n=1 Tax=Lignipirellula cremea TaxID=2528010 RepID=A0A518E3P3_9BACT|nr:sigma-70 family RNA polymerase sigma factor [Lignipirellula cremea]QDU98716.1 RNA polymerase sigma factor SigM [Lignipirellula cremea]
MTEPSADTTTENGLWIDAAVSQYEGRLLRYAQHLLGDAQQACDVVQDTFLKLCTANRTELEDRLAPWLFTVCRNRALNVLRKEKRMKSFSVDAPPVAAAAQNGPAETTEQRDTAECVQRLIAALPASQQECLRLRFQGGLTYREIGEVAGLSVSNVGYLIHTALAEVRRRVAD